jgi:hypothetical protein
MIELALHLMKFPKSFVRGNITLFPVNFTFNMQKEEYESLRSHFGALKRLAHFISSLRLYRTGRCNALSVLNSYWAVDENIQIMRAFMKLR